MKVFWCVKWVQRPLCLNIINRRIFAKKANMERVVGWLVEGGEVVGWLVGWGWVAPRRGRRKGGGGGAGKRRRGWRRVFSRCPRAARAGRRGLRVLYTSPSNPYTPLLGRSPSRKVGTLASSKALGGLRFKKKQSTSFRIQKNSNSFSLSGSSVQKFSLTCS